MEAEVWVALALCTWGSGFKSQHCTVRRLKLPRDPGHSSAALGGRAGRRPWAQKAKGTLGHLVRSYLKNTSCSQNEITLDRSGGHSNTAAVLMSCLCECLVTAEWHVCMRRRQSPEDHREACNSFPAGSLKGTNPTTLWSQVSGLLKCEWINFSWLISASLWNSMKRQRVLHKILCFKKFWKILHIKLSLLLLNP